MNDSNNPEINAKAGRNRAAILAAAEQLFARNGYSATRLEDVADTVGLTRTALFYYFRDKQALFEAMLEDAFVFLAMQLDGAFSTPGSISMRLEKAVEAWVDSVAARPTIAHLILRYIIDADQQPLQQISSSSERIFRIYWDLVDEGRTSGELKPLHEDPFHATSDVIGHTVFYISALATLLPSKKFKVLAPDQVAAHKSDVLDSMRRQLGIKRSRRVKKTR